MKADPRLVSLLTSVLARHGLELDALDLLPAGKRTLLRVTVDGDGPAGRGPLLDEIASATQAISAALDESSAMGERPYTLEVSSRGVGKPLTQERHYRRNTGRLIALSLTDGTAVTGRILGVRDGLVSLEVEGEARPVPLTSVRKGIVQVELNRLPDDEAEADDEALDFDDDAGLDGDVVDDEVSADFVDDDRDEV